MHACYISMRMPACHAQAASCASHGHVAHTQLAELRPQTPVAKARASVWAVALTCALFLLIALGSYAVFGEGVQGDVLHNFTPAELRPLLGEFPGTALYIIVRLSFLVSVLSLYPIMVCCLGASMGPIQHGLILDGLSLRFWDMALDRQHALMGRQVVHGAPGLLFALDPAVTPWHGPGM